MDSVVCGLSKMTSFQYGGSALIWFLCSGRKWLVFSVRIEINCFFVTGHSFRLDVRVGIKIDLISVISLVFMCGIEIDLVLASGSNLTCFLCGGQNRLWFCVQPENYLVLIYGSKLTWFLCAGRKWLVFSVSIELDFVFAWVVEIDLIVVYGPKMAWF